MAIMTVVTYLQPCWQLKQMWLDNRKEGLLDEKTLLAYVDSMARELDASQRLNFIRWPILNQMVHQNVSALGYYSVEQNKSHHTLNRMDADGGNKSLLTTTAANENSATWIKGGSKIAFLSNEGGSSQLWELVLSQVVLCVQCLNAWVFRTLL